MAAWVYVAIVALVQPDTLGIRLTHLTSQPHTDTFGEISFLVSLVSYGVYRWLLEGGDGPTR